MKPKTDYCLASDKPMEYDFPIVTTLSLTRAFGRTSYGAIHWIAAGVLMLFAMNSIVKPLKVDIDPWHGHVVIGGISSADRARALLDHRHSHESSSGVPSGDASAAVLSVAESEMISSLLDYDSYLALVPGFYALLFASIILLPVELGSQSGTARIGLAPPSPPPRRIAS